MSRLLRTIAALVALASTAALADTQVWDYISYKRDRTSGQFMKDLGNAGTLELIESDGKARFRIIAGRLDACYRGEIPAPARRCRYSTALTMSSTTFFASPKTIIVLSM